MTQSTFDNPQQFQVESIKVGEENVEGVFYSISIFESLYTPVITGNIVFLDSDGAGFIEENQIEFIEPIEFAFKNANGETLEFSGFLNGLRNEQVKNDMKYYTVDFSSKSVRKNEQTWVVKSFKDAKPGDIVSEMVEKMGGKLETAAGQGLPMTYIGSRKRPADVIKYVLTHGVSDKSQATEQGDQKEEGASGTTGFMCWETLDGYRFDTVDNINAGEAGTEHKDFKKILANVGLSMDEVMKSIVNVKFNQVGDFQTKMRSGAFAAKNISFDMDAGLYKEYYYYNDKNMTDQMKEMLKEGEVTRFFMKPYSNQKFQAPKACEPTKPATGDQSRRYLNQNAGRQNSFSDQSGDFTLYPHFKIYAGDVFDCKIPKVTDEDGRKSDGSYDEKNSGRYIIRAVGHHFFQNGTAYTQISTNRSTIQQNDASSSKT